MVFIDKSTQPSKDAKQRLENWKASFVCGSTRNNDGSINNDYQGFTLGDFYDKAELGELTGTKIWKIFGSLPLIKAQLRGDLSIEQDHICCYCGQQLVLEKTRIEHFLSKAKAFATRLFNYDNLLLSCDGTPEGQSVQRLQFLQGRLETIEELSVRMSVTLETIEEYNIGIVQNYNDGKINTTKDIYLGRNHCDPYKGYIEDKLKRDISIVNPTTHELCWQYFKVNNQGFISINETLDEQTKQLALNSIYALNLNADELQKKRKNAWIEFEKLWINEMSSQFDITTYRDIQLEIKQPFCFVNYHFIQQLME
jgi:uncharacterized protein (TIGR02646 family)